MRFDRVGSPTGSPCTSTKVRTPDCQNCLFLKSLVAASVPAATVDLICRKMWLNQVPARRMLYLEGSRATHLYAIRSGRICLTKLDVGGREHTTALLESGDLLGFETVFGEAYATGAETLTASELCLVSARDLHELVQTTPQFATDLTRYLHHCLLRSHERQVYLRAPGARAKLAGFLLHHVKADPDPVIPFPMTLREMGATVGLSPETVCRALGALKTEGVIESLPSGIRVLDLPALRACATAAP